MSTDDASWPAEASDLFRHLAEDKVDLYRTTLAVFAAAKRQYRLQLRPDEVLAEARWRGAPPAQGEVAAALAQLAAWGNLQSQPDMARGATLSDYYRARFLYRLSHGGEAVETGLDAFAQSLRHRAELQTLALEDIDNRLQSLRHLLRDGDNLDVAKAHEILRDLVRVFEDLAGNAQAFMAGVARSLDLQQADATAIVAYKRRLIEYLERFMGDLIRRADTIARTLHELSTGIDDVLARIAAREARDAAPGDSDEQADETRRRKAIWSERWKGLRGWFLSTGNEPPQAELLRARARAAIPQLLGAIAMVNERRSGRSDRSADFRVLAQWFAACADHDDAHRLARAAFALQPQRCSSRAGFGDADRDQVTVEFRPPQARFEFREGDSRKDRAALVEHLPHHARRRPAVQQRRTDPDAGIQHDPAQTPTGLNVHRPAAAPVHVWSVLPGPWRRQPRPTCCADGRRRRRA